MDQLITVFATLFLALVMEWCWRVWSRSSDAKRRSDAEKVLQRHGLVAHTYLASFANEAAELREALSAFDFTNKVILNQSGQLVGRLLPKDQKSGPGLRLVVDNTKS